MGNWEQYELYVTESLHELEKKFDVITKKLDLISDIVIKHQAQSDFGKWVLTIGVSVGTAVVTVLLAHFIKL